MTVTIDGIVIKANAAQAFTNDAVFLEWFPFMMPRVSIDSLFTQLTRVWSTLSRFGNEPRAST